MRRRPSSYPSKNRHRSPPASLLVSTFVLAIAACGGGGSPTGAADTSTSSSSGGNPQTSSQCSAVAATKSNGTFTVTPVASGLVNPWGFVFLPDGRMLVTERPGRLRIVDTAGNLSAPISGVPAVFASGQGGLLDVALDPGFASNSTIYFSFAEGNATAAGTAVGRAILDVNGLSLSNVSVIYRQQPKVNGGNHFGSRLAFGSDGKLYVSTGDRFRFAPAQDPLQGLGKIVRLNPDGSAPADNPFANTAGYLPEIWSLGHRNVQGMTRHPASGQLWTAEHGAMGGDEINTPERGKNYGWPVISYGLNYDGSKIGEGTAKAGMEQPRCYWDPSIAPGNLAFYTGNKVAAWSGNLFVAALKDNSLNRLTLNGTQVTGMERIPIGKRVRDVRVGPDGWLYLATDESAGQILRVTLQ